MRPYLGVGAPRKAALVVTVNAVLLLLLIVVVVAVAVVVVVVVLLFPPHGDSHISHSGETRPYLHRRLLEYKHAKA